MAKSSLRTTPTSRTPQQWWGLLETIMILSRSLSSSLSSGWTGWPSPATPLMWPMMLISDPRTEAEHSRNGLWIYDLTFYLPSKYKIWCLLWKQLQSAHVAMSMSRTETVSFIHYIYVRDSIFKILDSRWQWRVHQLLSMSQCWPSLTRSWGLARMVSSWSPSTPTLLPWTCPGTSWRWATWAWMVPETDSHHWAGWNMWVDQ